MLYNAARTAACPPTSRGISKTLIPEIGDSDHEQTARVGAVTNLIQAGREFRFRFVQNPLDPATPSARIQAEGVRLGLSAWEFSRIGGRCVMPTSTKRYLHQRRSMLPPPTAFGIHPGPPERRSWRSCAQGAKLATFPLFRDHIGMPRPSLPILRVIGGARAREDRLLLLAHSCSRCQRFGCSRARTAHRARYPGHTPDR